jgi:ABC-2 type transport system ATP-binding protein
MDPVARAEMKGILRALRDGGKTIVISSHILPEMAELCDSVAILNRGTLALQGTMDEVLGRSRGSSAVDVQVLRGMDAAMAALRQLTFIQGALADGGALRVRFQGGEEEMAVMLSAMTAAGAHITRFARNEANLEKVFLEVTGHEGVS